jgi:hypothetical protein
MGIKLVKDNIELSAKMEESHVILIDRHISGSHIFHAIAVVGSNRPCFIDLANTLQTIASTGNFLMKIREPRPEAIQIID